MADATGCGGNAIHSVAYLGSFDPNEVCANYLADIGDSPHPTGEYSFEVPTGARAFHEGTSVSNAKSAVTSIDVTVPVST